MRETPDELRVIGAAQTRASLDFPRLIAALRDAFARGAEVPMRHHHFIEQPGRPTATLLLMPAWQGREFLGVKLVTVYPGNTERGEPALSSSYLLCDGATGRHLALIDGNEITGRRTAATSALAASFLARPDAESLLVVGAGRVGSLLASAYRAVRPIRRVTVWDIVAERAEALAAALRGNGFEAAATADLQAAVERADIVSCATLATESLVRGAWLRPGVHLDLIGSFTPDMRETDDEAMRRARVFIDAEAALEESGDLLQPLKSGALRRDAVAGTLASLCRGGDKGRRDAAEITLFKAVGTALADLAAAMLAYGDAKTPTQHAT